MGACLSSGSFSLEKSSCAFVVSIEGGLIEYPTPIFVSEVLDHQNPSSSFICNSDSLYYDGHIPALDVEHQLEAGQIYFILEKTMLHRSIRTSDMAQLALKASLALDSHYGQEFKTKKNKARISPTTTAQVENSNNDYKKQRKLSSKKARLAVRSFSVRLSTIYENNEGCDELQFTT
ncbi:hypothetical protein SSX86_015038 [Deinandra increscens subsp. villosa]|uniref:Uncharacterized protein n=1 Tax=Deinandra increscens subsp. villosa TaxID=3103831 RepID=A0AAP0GYX2_9ASTR